MQCLEGKVYTELRVLSMSISAIIIGTGELVNMQHIIVDFSNIRTSALAYMQHITIFIQQTHFKPILTTQRQYEGGKGNLNQVRINIPLGTYSTNVLNVHNWEY